MTIKVLVAIPNEGTTLVESYANRLMNFMHLGNLQTELRVFNDCYDILSKENPDLAQKMASEFIKTKAKYVKVIDGKQFEFYFLTLGRILTPYAREKAAEIAVREDMEYLFFIDDDMICPDDLFERLYRHNVDIVAPLAFTRNYPHHAVIYSIRERYDPLTKTHGYERDWVVNYPKDKLVECDAVGFGAVLIKAAVLKAVPAPRFMTTTGAGEDVHFCYEAGRRRFRIFMDTTTKLGHLSHPVQITEDFVESVHREMKWGEDRKKPVYSKYKAQEVPQDEALLILGD